MQMELFVRAVFYIVRPARRRGARRLRVVSLSRLGVTVASNCCIRIVGGINRSQSPKGFKLFAAAADRTILCVSTIFQRCKEGFAR